MGKTTTEVDKYSVGVLERKCVHMRFGVCPEGVPEQGD